MTTPKWKIAIEEAISQFKNQTVIQISTLDATKPLPHVRSHIFRSFLCPSGYPNLPLLLTSTDIRAPKVAQLLAHSDIELAWWVAGTQQQFRLSGKAHVVPSPAQTHIHRHFLDVVAGSGGGGGGSVLPPPGQAVASEKRRSHSSYLALQALAAEEDGGAFDWEAARVETFKATSGILKAGWCRPVPGSRLEGGREEALSWPETLEEPREDAPEDSEERRNWETALGNFALVVVEPVDVDFVDLGVKPDRRVRYTRDERGQWDEEELVP